MSELKTKSNTLIIGIGNSGRADDSLGWSFLTRLPDCGHQCDREYRYQLQIEDAELLSHYTHVIFVDASRTHYKNGFSFRTCKSDRSTNFTTHKLTPEQTLALAQDLYNADTDAYILGISGNYWGLDTKMSTYAENNLLQAIKFYQSIIPHIIGSASTKPDLRQFGLEMKVDKTHQ